MHQNKIENIIRLSSDDRYFYFVREVVKLEEVWVVATPENIVTIVGSDGEEILPVWPHKEVLEKCVFEEMKHSGWYAKSITLSNFIDKCIPDMEQMDILFGVFYDLNRQALSVDAKCLYEDIKEEQED